MTEPAATRPSLVFELDNGISIAADANGDPKAQPVLFLHGGGQTRHAWAGSVEALAKLGFYAITMDHRGHGDSSWARRGQYEMEHFAEDLAAVAQRLDRPPVVVGASLGGLSILLAEKASPTPVAKAIILVDISPRMELGGVTRIIDFMRSGSDGFASLDEAADAIAAYQPHRKRERNLDGLAKNLRLDENGRYRWHWDPHLLEFWDPEQFGTRDHDENVIRERLEAAGRINAPLLLIRGRMSDVLSMESVTEFRRFAPHAEYVDLADAAHMVAGDRNDAFTETVVGFIFSHINGDGADA